MEKIGLLFNPTSGHTGVCRMKVFLGESLISQSVSEAAAAIQLKSMTVQKNAAGHSPMTSQGIPSRTLRKVDTILYGI